MTRQERIAYLERQVSNAKGAAEGLLLQAESFQAQLELEMNEKELEESKWTESTKLIPSQPRF